MTVHLEPCPFCGCELLRSKGKINPSAICPTEDCHGGKFALVLDDPAQVAAWNRRPFPMRPLPDDPSEPCDAFDGKPCIVGGWNDGTWACGEAYYNAEREGWWWAQTHETDAVDGRVHFKLEYWMPLPGAPVKERAR